MSTFEIPRELIPGSAGYVCVICENPLMTAMQTSCRHLFCKYCIGMWKKYDGCCPVCAHDMGTLVECPDIDDVINGFFETADLVAKQGRIELIRTRREATTISVRQNKNSNGRDEMKALMDQLKPPQTATDRVSTQRPPRTATAVRPSETDKTKVIARLLRDNEKFEEELNTVYSKILTNGERLTAREDLAVARLCGIANARSVGAAKGTSSTPPVDENKIRQNCRAHAIFGNMATEDMPSSMSLSSSKASSARLRTAGTSKTDFTGLPPPQLPKLPKEDSDGFDDLIDLTDDVLRIDQFLNANSFDTLTQIGEIEEEGLEDEGREGGGDFPILTDESLRAATNHHIKFGDSKTILAPKHEIHPEVMKHLEKRGFTVQTYNPNGQETLKNPFPAENSMEDYPSNLELGWTDSETSIGGRSSKHGSGKGSTTNLELTNKILQCRESLMNLREKEKAEKDIQHMSFNQISFGEQESHDKEYNLLKTLDESVGIAMEKLSTCFEPGPLGDGGEKARSIRREPIRRPPPPPTTIPQRPPHRPHTTAPSVGSTSKTKLREKPLKGDLDSVASLPVIITTREIDKKRGGTSAYGR